MSGEKKNASTHPSIVVKLGILTSKRRKHERMLALLHNRSVSLSATFKPSSSDE